MQRHQTLQGKQLAEQHQSQQEDLQQGSMLSGSQLGTREQEQRAKKKRQTQSESSGSAEHKLVLGKRQELQGMSEEGRWGKLGPEEGRSGKPGLVLGERWELVLGEQRELVLGKRRELVLGERRELVLGTPELASKWELQVKSKEWGKRGRLELGKPEGLVGKSELGRRQEPGELGANRSLAKWMGLGTLGKPVERTPKGKRLLPEGETQGRIFHQGREGQRTPAWE